MSNNLITPTQSIDLSRSSAFHPLSSSPYNAIDTIKIDLSKPPSWNNQKIKEQEDDLVKKGLISPDDLKKSMFDGGDDDTMYYVLGGIGAILLVAYLR